jgi:hypothetical protein
MTGVREKKSKRGQASGQVANQATTTLVLLQIQIAKLQREINKIKVSSRESLLARVRKMQNDPKWMRRVRSQYTKAVSERTLELNEEIPLHVE